MMVAISISFWRVVSGWGRQAAGCRAHLSGTHPEFGNPANGADSGIRPKGESILDAHPHRGSKNQRLSLQTLSLLKEETRAAGLRNRIFAAHGKNLPLGFPFAPAHHQHHQQKSCGEPKYSLHYHITHDRRFSFPIRGMTSSMGTNT
jgi:hypothetical protein